MSWVGVGGLQHRAGLMWLRYQQRPAGTMLQTNQLGIFALFDANCAGLSIGSERMNVAATAPMLSANSLPGGWIDGDGVSNHIGFVWASYQPGNGPHLLHENGIGLAIRGGQDCLGLRLGWQESLRILYPDADGYWKTDYDSRAPFAVSITPGEFHDLP